MDRRRAITTAGAVTAVATAAAVAFGANFGIFGLTHQDSKVGRLPVVEVGTRSPVTQPLAATPSVDAPSSPGADDDTTRATTEHHPSDRDGDEDD